MLCLWEENTRIVASRKGWGFFVTHDCEPTLRLTKCISRIEMEARGREVRVSQLARGRVPRGLLQACVPVPFSLSAESIGNDATWNMGHPVSNRTGVCLGFFCLRDTADSVGVICFISSSGFVGISFFFFFSPLHLAILQFTYLLSEPCHSFWI